MSRPRRRTPPILQWERYWVNNDGGDNTVLTLVDEDGNEVLQEAWNNLTLTASIARMANILKKYEKRIAVIYAESNSIGRPQIELLKRQVPNINIAEKNTSNASKAELVMKLQDALGSEELILMDIPEQSNEIATYTYDYDAQKNIVTYNAPNGLHDDRVISLGYANLAKFENKMTGNYTIYIK